MSSDPTPPSRIVRLTQSVTGRTRSPFGSHTAAPFDAPTAPSPITHTPSFDGFRPPAKTLSRPPFETAGKPAAQVVAIGTNPPLPTEDLIPAAKGGVTLVDHAAAQHALTLLCNKNLGQYRFRTTCSQLLVVLALEAIRNLPTQSQKVDGIRGAWNGVSMAKPVVLLAVTRDGLSLSHNLLDCVPGLTVGSISLERSEESTTPQARLHLASAPAFSDCRVLLFDPVIQSGNSVSIALNLVRQIGASDIALLTFTIAAQGLRRLQSGNPDLSLWTAHVDTEWQGRRDQVSILGDFASRLFV